MTWFRTFSFAKKLGVIILGVCIFFGSALAINTILTGYKLVNLLSLDLSISSLRYRFTNSCGKDVFIPTKTTAEYQSVINSSPACLAVHQNCYLSLVTVPHGTSRTFYSATSATLCTSIDQVRTCTDGVLSGSVLYQYATCVNSGCGHPGLCPIGEVWDDLLCDCVPETCFASEASILMADGGYKNIVDVKVGDYVQGETQVNQVIDIEVHDFVNRELYAINGGEYFVTSEHPFKTTEGWKAIDPLWLAQEDQRLFNLLNPDTLKVGDTLITENGEVLIETITSQFITEDMKVYNLKLDGDNTYFSEGFLVHNAKIPV